MIFFTPEDLTDNITSDTLPEVVRDLLLASTQEYKDFKIPQLLLRHHLALMLKLKFLKILFTPVSPQVSLFVKWA